MSWPLRKLIEITMVGKKGINAGEKKKAELLETKSQIKKKKKNTLNDADEMLYRGSHTNLKVPVFVTTEMIVKETKIRKESQLLKIHILF